MASSASSKLQLELMADGENAGNWGSKTNTNLTILETAVSGVVSITVSSPTTTLSVTNFTEADAHNAVWILTGTLTANTDLVIPAKERVFDVVNNVTLGSYTLTLKPSGGTGISLTSGEKTRVYCTGSTAGRANLAPGTAAGDLVQLDADAKLPAVDGSQLTGIGAGAPGFIMLNNGVL